MKGKRMYTVFSELLAKSSIANEQLKRGNTARHRSSQKYLGRGRLGLLLGNDLNRGAETLIWHRVRAGVTPA